MMRQLVFKCAVLTVAILGSALWVDHKNIRTIAEKAAASQRNEVVNNNHKRQLSRYDAYNAALLNVTTTTINNLTLQERRDISPQRVLLATWVFGEEAVNLRRFQMFVETASTSGFDLVIVGHPAPSFELPNNVHHFSLTWNQLVDRLVEKVFKDQQEELAIQIQNLRNSGPYKVCDFRPLMGHLFPELLEDYQWWGHVDNDLLLGNLTRFFPQKKLAKFDILAAIGHVWGPFTLFRNAPQVNTLFMNAQKYASLAELFLTPENVYFDEWGDENSAEDPKLAKQKSMAGIIKEFAPPLGIRGGGGRVEKGLAVWDMGECQRDPKKDDFSRPLPERCAECVYQRNPSNGRVVLTRVRDGQERALCHYQGSKNLRQEASLRNTTKFEELRQGGSFRVNWEEGFGYVLEE